MYIDIETRHLNRFTVKVTYLDLVLNDIECLFTIWKDTKYLLCNKILKIMSEKMLHLD